MPPDAALTSAGPARLDLAVADLPGASRLPAGWQALIDAMQGAVWLVDAAGLVIVAANAAAASLLGMPARRLVGRPVAEFCAAPDDVCFWNEVRDGLATGIDSETFVLRGETAVPVTRRVSRIPTAPGAPGTDLWVVSVTTAATRSPRSANSPSPPPTCGRRSSRRTTACSSPT